VELYLRKLAILKGFGERPCIELQYAATAWIVLRQVWQKYEKGIPVGPATEIQIASQLLHEQNASTSAVACTEKAPGGVPGGGQT